MRWKLPKYVNAYTDRNGTPRFYLRRRGQRLVPLPGSPWSEEFQRAYQEAMSGAPSIVNRSKPGTVAVLVDQYLNSGAFRHLAAETQRTRRNILLRFAKEHGSKRAATLRREHIIALVNGKSAKRFAARNFLKTLRVLMAFAVENGALRENPTAGVKNLSGKTEGYATWSEEHIATFRAHHSVGSRQRLALELLLCTAQRRSDIVKMGRQHLRKSKVGALIDVRQQKTGTSLAIPVHPELQEALDAMASDNLTFLTTHQGRGFSSAGFTNWFRDACNAAGLPKGLSAHGLRKAACRRLAEAGCSANVIASISGHKSLDEIELYTRAADQVRMAHQGMAALIRQNANAK